MGSINRQILLEVMVMIGAKTVQRLSKGNYHCKLSEIVNFEHKEVKVAVKNLKIPPMMKCITFKLYMGTTLETMKETDLKSYTVEYYSASDLCQRIECIASSSLGINRLPTLDFRDVNAITFFSDLKLSLVYKENRYVLRKNDDLVLSISSNLARILGLSEAIYDTFTPEEKEKAKKEDLIRNCEKNIRLDKSYYVSDTLCYFIAPKDNIIHFVLYDVIESCTVTPGGWREPILFSCNIVGEEEGPNLVVAEKNVSVPFLKDVRFGIFNSEFEPFDFYGADIGSNSFGCTLVFFTI